MTNCRDQGKHALESVLKIQQNVTVIEKYVFLATERDLENCSFNELYFQYIYEVIGEILKGESTLKTILSNLKDYKVGWKSKTWDKFREKREEYDDFLINPFKVAEGAVECGKCGSKRTFSFSRQTRSADEPMTTFVRCAKCQHNWRYSG